MWLIAKLALPRILRARFTLPRSFFEEKPQFAVENHPENTMRICHNY
jgi:hypothetical protein